MMDHHRDVAAVSCSLPFLGLSLSCSLPLQVLGHHIPVIDDNTQCTCLAGTGIPQHGQSSKNMALITLDYGIMRSLSIKWP